MWGKGKCICRYSGKGREKVSSIDIPDSCSNKFGKDVTAYKVKSHKYSKKEINTLMKALKTVFKKTSGEE